MSHVFNSFALAYFDILGFERRLQDEGLHAMLMKYLDIVSMIRAQNESSSFGGDIPEGVIGLADRKTYLNSRVFGAYASDSILLWTSKHFPRARYPDALGLSAHELQERARDAKEGWNYLPVPPDRFLDSCNELICLGLELSLPMRGAISMGDAVISAEHSLYLGAPMVEAARIEAAQRIVGASFAHSFLNQIVPNRYRLPLQIHMKQSVTAFSGEVLDWPRHWRKTRGCSAQEVVQKVASGAPSEARQTYENTLTFVAASDERDISNDTEESQRLDILYPQFRGPDVQLWFTSVREVDLGAAAE